jgi:hypothetical protein
LYLCSSFTLLVCPCFFYGLHLNNPLS